MKGVWGIKQEHMQTHTKVWNNNEMDEDADDDDGYGGGDD
jgi:hypothetical protein